MTKYDLSILVPSRNEMFLAKTIENILENIEGATEIIAILDGAWADPGIPDHERVTLVHHAESIGQRASTNEAARLSKARYLMKCDAHCAFDKGFDVKMLKEMHDDWTMVPIMKNLHAFDWICENGHRRYQGPSGPCLECGKPTTRDILWRAKPSPNSVSYCFDSTPHFQYFKEFAKRPEGQGEITPTMSLQGSCWMLTRDKYWDLNICDEGFGSWGSQGIEVAVKTWLSGGAVMVNRKTWYAHMFRTQGGDFGFPYPISGSQVEKAKSHAKDIFFNNKWPKQAHPLSWLVEKFWPVRGWSDEDLAKLKTAEGEPLHRPTEVVIYEAKPTKGIIYYTDNELPDRIGNPVQNQIEKISSEKNIPIVSSSLKPMNFGVKNINFPDLQRGILTLFKQILAALEASDCDIVFFCEHDVMYHPSHFDFTPTDQNTYYYNTNVWKLRLSDGFSLKVNGLKQLSGLCGYRKNLIKHYKKRVEIILNRQEEMKKNGEPIVNDGVSKYMGYEPGLHMPPRGVDDNPVSSWQSEYPIIDIRHDDNWTKNRWSKSEFHDQKQVEGWTETTADKIPGWNNLYETFQIQKQPSKGIIFYTDNQLRIKIAHGVQKQLKGIAKQKNILIISSSLKQMSFGDKNVHFPTLKRGYLTMFKQIVGALEASSAEIIFFCEHDVLYHPSHFDFIPPDENTFYYNQNVWFLRVTDGHALHFDVNQLSGVAVYRETALAHFRERYELAKKVFETVDKVDFGRFIRKMGFEPMTHGRIKWENKFKMATWKSKFPNIDIKHGENVTGARWKKDQYLNQQLLINWAETDDEIPGWGKTKELAKHFQ